MRERHVLLGVAPARAAWFGRVGQWATTGAIPAEFVRCVSLAELRARLASGRRFSAVLLDSHMVGLDRDLVGTAREQDVAVFVVDAHGVRDWESLGADATLAPDLARTELLEALAQHATMVGEATMPEQPIATGGPPPGGRVVAVTGAGGVGASVTAIALAQGLAASDPTPDVLLADCCRVADQAMLHDSRVVVPSLQELVEAHRAATPRPRDVRSQTFAVEERGYRLLLGLRQSRHWVTIRPRAFAATLASLRSVFDLVICDIEPDLEGEATTGSIDVEERHLMARTVAARASVVIVVGRPGMKGLHGLVRILLDLHELGVATQRLLPVVTPAPRGPRARAELAAALPSLVASSLGGAGDDLTSPLFLPPRRVDAALRDGVAIPSPLPRLLAGGVAAILNRELDEDLHAHELPERVQPGSLPGWTAQGAP